MDDVPGSLGPENPATVRLRELFAQLQVAIAEQYGVDPVDVEAVLTPGTIALIRSPGARPSNEGAK